MGPLWKLLAMTLTRAAKACLAATLSTWRLPHPAYLLGSGTNSNLVPPSTRPPAAHACSLAFNSLASAIGDDRAATVRRKYGKPLKAVVILGSEVLPSVP